MKNVFFFFFLFLTAGEDKESSSGLFVKKRLLGLNG